MIRHIGIGPTAWPLTIGCASRRLVWVAEDWGHRGFGVHGRCCAWAVCGFSPPGARYNLAFGLLIPKPPGDPGLRDISEAVVLTCSKLS
jgi:hypothetical protein